MMNTNSMVDINLFQCREKKIKLFDSKSLEETLGLVIYDDEILNEDDIDLGGTNNSYKEMLIRWDDLNDNIEE